MSDSYKKLETQTNISEPSLPSMPPPYEFEPNVNFTTTPQIGHPVQFAQNFNQPTGFKLWTVMKRLVVVELILAIVSLIIGSACTGASYGNYQRYYNGVCFEASGIWVAILCIVAAALGLGALSAPTGHRGLMVAHLVLLIISTVGCAILIMFSSAWISYSRLALQVYDSTDGVLVALLIFNIILLLISIALFVLSIISSALICYNWNCCCKASQPQVVIVYQNTPQQEAVISQNQVRNY